MRSTGCTSDESDSSVTHYLCDMTTVGGSITFADFTDSEPQRLSLYNVDHSISSSLTEVIPYNAIVILPGLD
jgi:hypothetical protein